MKISKLMLCLLFAGLMMAFAACSSDDDDDKSVVNVSESDIVGMWYDEEEENSYEFIANHTGVLSYYDEDEGNIRNVNIRNVFKWTLSGDNLILRAEGETMKAFIKSYNKNELRLVDDEGYTYVWTRVSDDFGE